MSMSPGPTRHRKYGVILPKILVSLGVVLGVLAYIAVAGSTGFCPTCTAIMSAVTGTQDNVEVASMVQPAPIVGAGPVHELVMTDLGGEPVALSQFAGQPMAIDIWATWCGPCRQSRAELHKIADEVPQYGTLVSISVDRGGAQVVQDYIRTKEGGSSPFIELMSTDPRLMSVLKPFDRQPTIPKLVFVDATGNVVDIEYGVVDPKWVLNRLKALSSTGSRG